MMEVLQIVALSSLAALVTEAAMYLWAFRRDSFRTLRANIDRQARKLDELKAAPHAPGPQGKLAKQKKVDKLDKAIRGQMAKELGGVKLKQALVMGAGLLVVFKLASSLYSGHAVAKLPFAPFSLLAKLTQRGIEKAAIDDCSMAFIYALCQAGVRPSISKLLDWGLSRRMLELSNAHAQEWAQPADGKVR